MAFKYRSGWPVFQHKPTNMKHILILSSLLIACTTEQQPPAVELREVKCPDCPEKMAKIAMIINGDFNAGAGFADDQAYAQAAYVAIDQIKAEVLESGCPTDTIVEITGPPGICPDTLQ